ncbi:myrcene synthase, chloroplastic-like [Nymphaea colorata]|nr:myrcene synthase, chloroplastic-like [Nymphaea colorata]
MSGIILNNIIDKKHERLVFTTVGYTAILDALANRKRATARLSAPKKASWRCQLSPQAVEAPRSTQGKHGSDNIEEIKEDVKQLMVDACHEPVAQMELLDTLQRIGISYHFEKEIKVVMDSIFEDSKECEDLHAASLRFRLLRQHGYPASPEVFKVFKDERGKFKNTLAEDVKGLLSLYEASHLGFDGENILEEAMTFTTYHLKEMFSRWWRGLELAENLKFSRDRLMENYVWTIGINFNPLFSVCRKGLTKLHRFITIIDDVYDVYGTIDELELCTEAVERWDIGYIDKLPQYMRMCFLALYNTINQFAYEFMRDKGLNIISWGDLCKAYLVEARWLYNGFAPTVEEYLDNAWVSKSGPVILIHAYFLVQHDMKEHAAVDLHHFPNLIKISSWILRLHDDVATSKDETQRGDVPKCIQCYKREKGVWEEAARQYVDGLVRNAWKELHKECTEATANGTSHPLLHWCRESCKNGTVHVSTWRWSWFSGKRLSCRAYTEIDGGKCLIRDGWSSSSSPAVSLS